MSCNEEKESKIYIVATFEPIHAKIIERSPRVPRKRRHAKTFVEDSET